MLDRILRRYSASLTTDVAAGKHLDPHQVIPALSDEHRAVVVLHYLAEFPVNEVASLLDIPIETVKMRLARAERTAQIRAPDGSWWISGTDPATGRWALAVSRDDGRTWSVRPLPAFEGTPFVGVSVIAGPGMLYATVSGGLGTNDPRRLPHHADNSVQRILALHRRDALEQANHLIGTHRGSPHS